MSIRVLEPLRSGQWYLMSSASWCEVKPIPVHVMIGRRTNARGGLAGTATGNGINTIFPLSLFDDDERRIL
jgi:hypothetical protein